VTSNEIEEENEFEEEDDEEILKDPDVVEEDDPELAQPDAEEDLAGTWIVPAPISATVEAIVPEEGEEVDPDA
jgi:hypothetical protein